MCTMSKVYALRFMHVSHVCCALCKICLFCASIIDVMPEIVYPAHGSLAKSVLHRAATVERCNVAKVLNVATLR